MKKLFTVLFLMFLIVPQTFADERYAAILDRVGFDKKVSTLSPQTEVKNAFLKHIKYSNSYDYDNLFKMYSPNYLNSDGFDRDVYFKLIKQTWDNYPSIKYAMTIKNITVEGDTAIVETEETATALTGAASDVVSGKGLLESFANSVYYLEKRGDKWQIVSDRVIDEQTSLKYGDAKFTDIELTSPQQVGADKDYTATLSISAPKERIVIASIGREKVTYPQETAEEVFRKLPDDGILERMFKANSDNINEYVVASIGLTKAEIKDNTNIRIYLTGLGFVMSRVNVIPQNNFIKEKDDKIAEQNK